ncbi:MAG: hypothetical protein CME62_06645 [Halobacteriovoraceae bacterium]|nr:hypothetical protein [Halobacteriovoraceae bacterium]
MFYFKIILFIFLLVDRPVYGSVSKQDFEVLKKDFLSFIVPFAQKVKPEFEQEIIVLENQRGFGAFSGHPMRIFQGVLDSKPMTIDALAMVLCHEIGHDLKIARFYTPNELSYAFEHLEQDYFAAYACFRPLVKSSKLLKSLMLTPSQLNEIPLSIQDQCAKNFPQADAEICLRSIHAGWRSMQGLYQDYLFDAYENIWGLPAPSMERAWLGGYDSIQARILNFINASLNEKPLI